MQAHIRRQYERLESEERQAERKADYQVEQAIRAARREEDAYLARAIASFRAGEPEEEFEIREAAARAERYRLIERANAEISRIFAAATPQERRAA